MAVQPFVLKPFIDLCIPLFFVMKKQNYVNPIQANLFHTYLVRHESLKIHLSFVIFISIPDLLIEVFVDLL